MIYYSTWHNFHIIAVILATTRADSQVARAIPRSLSHASYARHVYKSMKS